MTIDAASPPNPLLLETAIGEVVVETLCLRDPIPCDELELRYASRVCGGELHGERYTYGTLKAARAGHAWLVARVRRLVAKGGARRTYVIAQFAGHATITCLACGYTSHNPNDVRERYCGHCHWFHEDAIR